MSQNERNPDYFQRDKCGDCRFFGCMECKRRSPIRTSESGAARWPFVDPGDWCGDFERKQERA